MERETEVAIAKQRTTKKKRKEKPELPSEPRIKITLLLYYISLVAK